NTVDFLVHVDTADDFSDAVTRNVNVLPDAPPRIALGLRESDFPRLGTGTGPQVITKRDFTSLVASFNPHAPPNTGVTLDLRVKQGDAWSPWVFMQAWGKVLTPPDRVTKL